MNQEQPSTTQPAAKSETPKKRNIRLPIILMAWPAVGIIVAIVLFGLNNFIISSTAPAPTDGELFAQPNPLQSAINVAMFLLGALSVALGPISFIIGLVLLIIRLQKK